jgi:hypothetical protein
MGAGAISTNRSVSTPSRGTNDAGSSDGGGNTTGGLGRTVETFVSTTEGNMGEVIDRHPHPAEVSAI